MDKETTERSKEAEYQHDARQFLDHIYKSYMFASIQPEGINWQGQWLPRDFLSDNFDHLLGIYRAWQFTTGQGRSLLTPSDATAS